MEAQGVSNLPRVTKRIRFESDSNPGPSDTGVNVLYITLDMWPASTINIMPVL